ncbi:MAG TPA: hypothetical protein VJT73_04635 [Polyangiaceae bacterium]|nr:hypothetical protein [Polyangiaceae bacterium]
MFVFKEPGAVFFAVFGTLLVATELGFRAARRRSLALEASALSLLSTLEAAILGLLALLLGFSFSMAANRYETRKQVLLDEANAIGTTYLRRELLPEPERARVTALLRRYIDVRIEFYDRNRERADRAEATGREIQKDLWAEAVLASAKNEHPVSVGLFVSSLNDLIDLDEKRLVALENRVPETVFVLLVLIASTAAWATGHAAGRGNRRFTLEAAAMPFLVACVVAFIVDLDRPMRGFVRTGQASMVRTRAGMQAP